MAAYFCSVSIGIFLHASMRSSAREVDFVRFLLDWHRLPAVSHTLFVVGNISLISGLSVVVYVQLDSLAWVLTIEVLIIVSCLFAMLYIIMKV
jgi:hypothetical protein